MGQKVNPNIFRLGITKNYKTEYYEKKINELKLYTYQDIEIKNFLEKFFEQHNLILHDYKIYYNDSILNIYISYRITLNYNINHNNNIKNNFHNIIIFKRTKRFFKKFRIKNTKNFKFKTNNNFSKIKNPIKLKNYIFKKKKYFRFDHKQKNIKIYKKTIHINRPKTKIKILLKKKNLLLNSKNYLINFYKSLNLFTNNKYKIKIIFNCLNKNFNLNTKQKKILKEKFFKLRKFKNSIFFKEGINIFFNTVYYKNSANLLAKFLAVYLKNIKSQKFFLNFVKKSLTFFINSNFSKVKGIKILIKGKLTKASKAKQKILNIGEMPPCQTIKANIDYANSKYLNSNGTSGIKVWLSYKN